MSAVPARKLTPDVTRAPDDGGKSFSQRVSEETATSVISGHFLAGAAETLSFPRRWEPILQKTEVLG